MKKLATKARSLSQVDDPKSGGSMFAHTSTQTGQKCSSARAFAVVMLFGASALMLLGVTNARLKDGRFDVSTVTVAGPATIANGGSANYTVTVNINRTGAGANDTITGTSGIRIRPQLTSNGTQLVFGQINFAPGQNARTVTLSLSCINNEVRGVRGGSGHGNPSTRPFWCFWCAPSPDPAPIKGTLNEKDSTNTINVTCTGG
jgi:hypothetical protein